MSQQAVRFAPPAATRRRQGAALLGLREWARSPMVQRPPAALLRAPARPDDSSVPAGVSARHTDLQGRPPVAGYALRTRGASAVVFCYAGDVVVSYRRRRVI